MIMELFLIASLYLFHSTNAQSAAAAAQAQQPAPRALHYTSNQSFAILLFIVVIAFFITGIFSFYIRLCSQNYVVSGTTTIGLGPKGLDPEVLSTFPVMLYSTVSKAQNAALQCAVCLSEFRDFDKLRLLPKCSHVFHPGCIDVWLASHVTCPVCRAELNNAACGEVALEIEHGSVAHQVFDESSVRSGEAVFGGNEDGVCGKVDGCNGKNNGSSKMTAFEVLFRSHSTGHSLVEVQKDLERFTLRLSEEVIKQILDDDKHGGSMMIKRSASYGVL